MISSQSFAALFVLIFNIILYTCNNVRIRAIFSLPSNWLTYAVRKWSDKCEIPKGSLMMVRKPK